MARYKPYDVSQDKFIPVAFCDQILPSSFEPGRQPSPCRHEPPLLHPQRLRLRRGQSHLPLPGRTLPLPQRQPHRHQRLSRGEVPGRQIGVRPVHATPSLPDHAGHNADQTGHTLHRQDQNKKRIPDREDETQVQHPTGALHLRPAHRHLRFICE